jgi:Domain of unknown function (DUF4276)
MSHIGLVVEGRADHAVSGLIRRYLAERWYTGLLTGKPIRAKDRGKLLKQGELERFVKLAAYEPGAVAVLVLFDGDRDPACELGPQSLARVQGDTPVPVRICIAIRSIENWILASAETTLKDGQPLSEVEGAGAVHAVKEAMKPGSYNKPAHQPGLLERIDFDLARGRCPSFDRFLRIVDEIAEAQAELN